MIHITDTMSKTSMIGFRLLSYTLTFDLLDSTMAELVFSNGPVLFELPFDEAVTYKKNPTSVLKTIKFYILPGMGRDIDSILKFYGLALTRDMYVVDEYFANSGLTYEELKNSEEYQLYNIVKSF